MPPYELTLHVTADDIDGLGHVNNIVYVRWVQEAATAHWLHLAPDEDAASVAWVLRRHEIDYRAPAMPYDAIVARTWVGTAEGLTFERHTEILRAADRKVLARSRTLWCPINVDTGRPTRVSPAVRALFSVPEV